MPWDATRVQAGSTLRPIARFVVDGGGEDIGAAAASVVLGRAEIFEREAPEYAVARLTWAAGREEEACAVMSAAVRDVPVGESVYFPVNAAVSGDLELRRGIAESCGLELFQEKEGFWWQDDGRALGASGRLRVRGMADVGQEEFVSVIGRCIGATLDRADSLTMSRSRPRDWAARFLQRHARAGDEESWLLASHPTDGATVGFVGVSERSEEPRTGVVSLIGVLPEHRGKRYVDELVFAAYRAARARAMTGVLSLVDVQNHPMMAAMRRTGASADSHPWHKWLYAGRGGAR